MLGTIVTWPYGQKLVYVVVQRYWKSESSYLCLWQMLHDSYHDSTIFPFFGFDKA